MEERLENPDWGKIFGENFEGSAYQGVKSFNKKLKFPHLPLRSFTRGEISSALYSSGVASRQSRAEAICNSLSDLEGRISIQLTSQDYYLITPLGRDKYKLGYATTYTGPR